MKTGWLLIAVLLLMEGCAKQYEHHVPVASCETGDLYVREQVELDPGLSGTSASVKFALYYINRDGRRVDIPASGLGSYRSAAEDRLRIYRSPRQGDWQLYVSPAALAPDEYAALSNCIGAKISDIYRQMALAREPRSFRSEDRAFPEIATIRHADLMDLRKRYACEPQGAIQVREDGQIWYQGQTQVLVGAVLDGGKRIALNEGALTYLASLIENVTRDPISYLQSCQEQSGRSMFENFEISRVPGAADKGTPGQPPSETSAASARAEPTNTAAE